MEWRYNYYFFFQPMFPWIDVFLMDWLSLFPSPLTSFPLISLFKLLFIKLSSRHLQLIFLQIDFHDSFHILISHSQFISLLKLMYFLSVELQAFSTRFSPNWFSWFLAPASIPCYLLRLIHFLSVEVTCILTRFSSDWWPWFPALLISHSLVISHLKLLYF